MNRFTRIKTMENKYRSALSAVHAMNRALVDYCAVQEDILVLEKYLSSKARRNDLAADEEGLLPSSLTRGVLSEDGLYNLLEENDELRRELARILDT